MMSQPWRLRAASLLALMFPAFAFSQFELPPLPPVQAPQSFVPLQAQPNVQQLAPQPPAPQQPNALPNGIEVMARG
ncbi:MAG: hypothetical protein K2X38_21185, partial [Gemmataceae bacterium]|nr:hypothetical protein [Gemmataceae bacterium]